MVFCVWFLFVSVRRGPLRARNAGPGALFPAGPDPRAPFPAGPGRAGHRSDPRWGGGRRAGRDGESADNPQAALEEIHVRSLPAGLGRTLALWEALVMPAGTGPGRAARREGEVEGEGALKMGVASGRAPAG